jgi:2-polyprenyl-3-methyl-5-hydroxy-6-metoxy-1,4-benzoquinol methylase
MKNGAVMVSTEARSRSTYEHWHERVHAEDAAADQPWHALVQKYVRPADLADRHVLEIGCGRGELARALATSTAIPRRLVAADFAQSAVRLGAARGRRDGLTCVSWMVADVQAIGLPAETFDTIISCETIEHLTDPVGALREFHRLLKPGGRVVVTTPNYMGAYGLYRAYLRLRGRRFTEGGQPVCRLTSLPRTWLWLRRAGFRVRAVDTSGHYLLWPGRVPSQPQWLLAMAPWLWPFGLHSVFVADKAGEAS